MRRQVSLEEISDGRLYTATDMVKADCGGCEGCSACCRGMGESIILDPLDVWRLTTGLGRSFSELLAGEVELKVVDGVILPNLKMAGPEAACRFLDEAGRCRIHAIRPGVCRLFPLGRVWEGREFRYFLQVHECPKQGKTKIKVKNWIDTPDIRAYENFVREWHGFVKALEAAIQAEPEPTFAKNMNLYMLNTFFVRPYGAEDFYGQFAERLKEAGESLGV